MPEFDSRRLTPLEKSPTFPYGTWDIEASDWWNLEMIGVWDGHKYYHFRDIDSFLDHILQSHYKNYRWFAHYGGRYDFNFVFDHLQKRNDYDVSFYCAGSAVIQMTIRKRSNPKILVKLCDSYRLFYNPGNLSQTRTDNKSGLRDLGKAFNVRHQKGEIDFASIKYGKECIEYNEIDCRCLYEVIERFFEETQMQSETFASHALKVWRKDFLKETIWKPRQEICDFVRQSYHGGRVEVFKRESPAIHAYDVNSMYPYVMLQPMPVEYAGECKKLLDSDTLYGFVRAQVIVPDSYIPCLPVRLDKLFFPSGAIDGIWSSEELQIAESRGVRIQKIIQAYYFRTVTIFKEYVDKLYALKCKASEPTRTIAKGLLNALYGKFGQTPTKKLYMTESSAPDGAFPIMRPDGSPSGFAYIERTSRAGYLLPHLAAAVTSKARLHLFAQLNNNSYYCDTDSVFTSDEMPTSNTIGGWSEVGTGEATFIQPKLYKFRGTWKSKGLNKSESIDAFIEGFPNHVLRTKSIRESLRDGERACQHIQVEKMLRETRPKRAWCGNDTRPWDYRELL